MNFLLKNVYILITFLIFICDISAKYLRIACPEIPLYLKVKNFEQKKYHKYIEMTSSKNDATSFMINTDSYCIYPGIRCFCDIKFDTLFLIINDEGYFSLVDLKKTDIVKRWSHSVKFDGTILLVWEYVDNNLPVFNMEIIAEE
ncbi:hypothetical protein K9L05_03045 [Candidatus Babeliales bacterium]|nr:hypothetical protein [Candidatus Babeliales bacterium]MCF7899599.1 hypothetical protein [Candidatus Babeliales bacterium]